MWNFRSRRLGRDDQITARSDEALGKPLGTLLPERVRQKHDEHVLLVPNAALRFAPPQVVENAQGGSGLLGLIMPKAPATAMS